MLSVFSIGITLVYIHLNKYISQLVLWLWYIATFGSLPDWWVALCSSGKWVLACGNRDGFSAWSSQGKLGFLSQVKGVHHMQITSQKHKWYIANCLNLKKQNFMAPFYGWGPTSSRLVPLQGGSLLFTTKFPDILGTQFIDLRRMKGWVNLGDTQWFWTRDPWIGNPAS